MSERVQNVLIDYVGLTFKVQVQPHESADEAARSVISEMLSRWFVAPVVQDTGRGWSGYGTRLDIEGIGLVAYGGNGGTVHFEFTGDGCKQLRDWLAFADDVESVEAKLTRCDIAYDDLYGQDWSIEKCRDAYMTSGFKPSRGMSPNAKYISDEGSGKGCTYYVGSRESGKLFRGYEKGKEQGDPLSPWFRLEVEWRATHRELPLDMLRDPSRFFAGAYACLSGFCGEQEPIKTVQFSAAASIEKAVDHAKKQAGRVLRALAEIARIETGEKYLTDSHLLKAVRSVIRPDMPSRLLSAIYATKAVGGEVKAPAWWKEPTAADRARTESMLKLDFNFWKRVEEQTRQQVSHLFSPAPAASAYA